ncbi:hypothetical protein [Wenxinia marina]|uniref:Periplasmic protein n=1 Tax=Wenxinia marina DSM 24838 TaxID=1123501 RepID=A0A0D0P8J5_9RHOB|nr:hypothetical protein [Wenxinia marina]KIQ67896.1 hypothetical protein Wenmar_03626 [Wenxinia marina DSM 24838]GGL74262.1 hypothetical protein GCM10011392_31010 [Wenxinia marina]
MRLAVIAAVAALFAGPGALAATFELSDIARRPDLPQYPPPPRFEIRLSGEIVPGDVERLEAMMADADPEGFGPYRLVLDSPGGNLDAGLALVDAIRARWVQTYIPADVACLSVCALVFMAGTYHDGDGEYGPWREMHHTATLGFHAPFAVAGMAELDPDVSALLAPAAERGASLAAAELTALALDNVLPQSLVRELLTYDASQFLYIDTVDRAGRWGIPLENARRLTAWEHEPLARLCDNGHWWGLDRPMEERPEGYLQYLMVPSEWALQSLEEGRWGEGGMEYECLFTNGADGVVIEVRSGLLLAPVALGWQALPPETLLRDLGPPQIAPPEPWRSAALDLPPETAGPCRDGTMWLGRRADDGTDVSAGLYSCDRSVEMLRFECDGRGRVEVRLGVPPDMAPGGSFDATLSVDPGAVPPRTQYLNGTVVADRGAPQASLGRFEPGSVVLEWLSAGSVFEIASFDHGTARAHLAGSRAALAYVVHGCN